MKNYNPTTPSRRHMMSKDFSVLTKKKPEKKLLVSLKSKGGRNNTGRITSRHQGGGSRKIYRIIEFGQKRLDDKAKVIALEYDPNRTAFLALIEYQDKEKKYIIAPQNLKTGDEIVFAEQAPINPGNRLKLKNIPVGTSVYNIELIPGQGGKSVRGAGSSAVVLAHENQYCQLKFPSTEIRKVLGDCFASVGQVSCPEHRFIVIGKAGRSRHMGVRPRVRGTAMNPCDHPHGGGEGSTPIGLKYPKTPWGKHAKGVKTRKRKKYSDKLIMSRRQTRKR